MPDEWGKVEIIEIHKKGDQQKYKNYRVITLLNMAYKIMSTII